MGDLLAGDAPDVGHPHRDTHALGVGGEPERLDREVAVGEPIAERVAHHGLGVLGELAVERVEVPVADVDALGVLLVLDVAVVVAEGRGRRVVVVAGRPRVGEFAGRVHPAVQHVDDGVAHLLARQPGEQQPVDRLPAARILDRGVDGVVERGVEHAAGVEYDDDPLVPGGDQAQVLLLDGAEPIAARTWALVGAARPAAGDDDHRGVGASGRSDGLAGQRLLHRRVVDVAVGQLVLAVERRRDRVPVRRAGGDPVSGVLEALPKVDEVAAVDVRGPRPDLGGRIGSDAEHRDVAHPLRSRQRQRAALVLEQHHALGAERDNFALRSSSGVGFGDGLAACAGAPRRPAIMRLAVAEAANRVPIRFLMFFMPILLTGRTGPTRRTRPLDPDVAALNCWRTRVSE